MDIRAKRLCPYYLKNTNVMQPPCLDCVFYDVDYRQCRIIRTDENVLALLRLLREERSQNRNMY